MGEDTVRGVEPGDPGLAGYVQALNEGLVSRGESLTPDVLVRYVRKVIPHAQDAGLSLLRPQRPPVSVGSSGPLPDRVDQLQHRLREGPCLDAATGPSVVMTGDLGSDARWPLFGPECVRSTGVRSALALRLALGGEDHAAVNVYSQEPDAFTTEDVLAGSALVPFAGLIVEAHLRRSDVQNLLDALTSSRSIGTAVGIVMATHQLTQEQAFEALRRASMDLNQKLRDVAAEVAYTGVLPNLAEPGPDPGAGGLVVSASRHAGDHHEHDARHDEERGAHGVRDPSPSEERRRPTR